MKRIHNFVFIYFIFIFIFLACKRNERFLEAEFYDLGKEGLLPGLDYIFYPFKDSLKFSDDKLYSIDIAVRYTDAYKLKSLPLWVEYASLNSDTVNKTFIELPLFEEHENKELSHYGIYETDYVLLPEQSADEGFFISISSEQPSTSGIISLGIICANKKNI